MAPLVVVQCHYIVHGMCHGVMTLAALLDRRNIVFPFRVEESLLQELAIQPRQTGRRLSDSQSVN